MVTTKKNTPNPVQSGNNGLKKRNEGVRKKFKLWASEV